MNATPRLATVDGVSAAIDRLAGSQAASGMSVRVFLERDAVSLLGRFEASGRAAQPDLVHFHSVFRPFHALLAARLCRAGIPYVTSPHSGLSLPALARQRYRKSLYSRLVERRFMHRAGGISCLTDVERCDVERFAPGCPAHLGVVPNALPAELLGPPLWAPRRGRPTVVTLARYDVRQKGLDRLALLAALCPGIDFAVYGAPDYNEPDLARELAATAPPNLTLRPPVFGHAKLEVLTGATLFALPSRWEGLSIALMEAMALGVPCAVSGYVGATQPIEAAGLGLVLDRDVDVAAARLRAAVAQPALLRQWSKASAAHAQRMFAPAAVAAAQSEFYRRAVTSARSGAVRSAPVLARAE